MECKSRDFDTESSDEIEDAREAGVCNEPGNSSAIALRSWNRHEGPRPCKRAEPEPASMWACLALQARRTPDAVAIAGDREEGRPFRITYRALDLMSARLAWRLQKMGVALETPVAICMGRVPEMMIAMWAILRAGGAYVPLSSRDPAERLTQMVRSAGIPLVLCDSGKVSTFARAGIANLVVESHRVPMPELGNPPRLAPIHERNLIYLIFTSGSTGAPKAVAAENRSLLRYCRSLCEFLGLGEGLNFALVSTLAADLGNTAIFPCFLSGGCLHLISRDTALLPEAYAAYNRRNFIDFVKMVPTHLEALLNGATAADALPRRFLVLGGEACAMELIHAVQSLGRVRTFNHYGPSEATVGICAHEAEKEAHTVTQRGHLSLGKPFPHAEALILDYRCRPVAQRATGELWIGGEALARGYWRRPDLTAERFVPNPESWTGGSRLYRSGDLARRDGLGRLEFLGRDDHQIKIRGFRIELGEIETIAERHPTVARAVVIARDRGRVGQAAVDTYLASYIQIKSDYGSGLKGTGKEIGDLRRFLTETLPAHMIPAAFTVVERPPLTANGKIDRRALPKPSRFEAGNDAWVDPPRNARERRMLAIWESILNIRPIGIHQHFAELGGHSLLGTKMIIRIRQDFQVELTPMDLFESSSIAQLAAKVRVARRESRPEPGIQAESRSAEGPAPLSFAQQRLWFLQSTDPTGSYYHVCRAYRLNGPLSPGDFKKSLELLTARHECLRTAVRLFEDQPVQIIEEKVALPLTLVDLSQGSSSDQEPEIQTLILAAYERGFLLEHAPLTRFLLVRLGPHEHLFMAVMHHLISDGWSMVVFLRELSACYDHILTDKPAHLPRLPVRYTDYARRQRRWLESPEYRRQLGFWRGQLSPAPPVLSTDRARGKTPAFLKQTRPVLLPPQLNLALNAFSREMRGTLFVTLLSAFQVLLWRYSGQTSVAVGAASANRNQEGLEHMIGLFVNSLVIRADLARNPSFRELRNQVQATTLMAQNYQNLPFEKLVEALNPHRDARMNPLFQAMFLFQPQSNPFSLRGLALQPFPMGFEKTLLDIILVLEEEQDGIRGHFVFNAEVYLKPTMDRLSRSFAPLLESLLRQADVPLFELPPLP